MSSQEEITNEVKLLHKRHKIIDRQSIRLLLEFCQYNSQRTNKILLVLKSHPNPRSLIQRLIQRPEQAEVVLKELQKLLYQEQEKEVQIVSSKQYNPNSSSFAFFSELPHDIIIKVMGFLDRYTFSSMASTCSLLNKLGKSAAHQDYYERICAIIIKKTPSLPQFCRFQSAKEHALAHPLEYNPNIIHGMTVNLRKFIWQCEGTPTQKEYFQSFGSYKMIVKNCPKVNYNGVYLCKSRYVRVGIKDKNNAFAPIHIGYYYRYLRLFYDGSVLYIVSNKRLNSDSLIKQLSEQNLNNENVLKGEWLMYKDELMVKTVRPREIFSYVFRVDKNTLFVKLYQLQLIDSQIKQTLYEEGPNRETFAFTYYHVDQIGLENSQQIRACSL